jgi:cell division protein FtsN
MNAMGCKGAALNRTARLSWALCAGAILLSVGAVPAWADVKDGVDAWTRGDYEGAVAQWQGPAATGDADAMFNMGQAYKLGRGVPKDLAKAENFYARAAKKGHVRAADNYAILLFQTNRQNEAMPWLNAAADRGEPRAMYILGIAAYNGDYTAKDPVRAYALMTRAAQTGLQQAITSLAAMNEAIPLEQRQQGAAMAGELDSKTTATRASELGSADLGNAPGPTLAAATTPAATRPVDPIPLPAPVPAVASHARPATAPVTTPKPPVASAKPASTGTWRVQLGAFGQKANADALWSRLRSRPEIAGHPRIDSGTGVARLMAGGYSEAEAQRVCVALKAAGLTCLVVNH